MKYLKTYEAIEHTMGKYWHINIPENLDDFGAYLNKIGVTDEYFSKIIDSVELNNSSVSPPKGIYIGNVGKPHNHLWVFYYNQKFDDKYYDYQGEVELTDEEIENWRVKKSAEKYNL